MWQYYLKLLSPKRSCFVRQACYYSIGQSRKIAVCQMTSVADKEANMEVVSDLISRAASENVKMVFFPEACDYLCHNVNETVKSAEPIVAGPTVHKYRELAAKHNIWLSMGGVHEIDDRNPSKFCDTHIIIDNRGDIVQTYRKLHVFDVELPERNIRLKESEFCKSGNHIITPVDTPVGRVGLAVCYDLRFPELSTSLGIMNAEILTYPSAFTQLTGAAHWHVLLRARAIENQCYVIAAAQAGSHNQRWKSYGHSLCIDPWGEVLVDCGEESPCYKTAEISEARLRDVRSCMPVFNHRRNDIYAVYALSLRKHLLPSHVEQLDSTESADQGGQCEVQHRSVEPEHHLDERVFPFGELVVPESCVFHQSTLCYAFVNFRCVVPGHVLVAPRRVAPRNQDLTDDEAQDFFSSIRLVQRLMERVHKTDSCTITIQDGFDAGQTVQHIHCHIMPRKQGDHLANDLIYMDMAKNDKSKHSPPIPDRTPDEMIAEATYLKSQLENMLTSETRYVR